MHVLAAIVASVATIGVASAAEISIPVADGTSVEELSARYQCDDRIIDVVYINAGSTSLAVLDLDDRKVVAASVIAGSGARYAGDRYIWWTKGNEAALYDLMDGGEETPAATCMETS